jgi:hypothetical protein
VERLGQEEKSGTCELYSALRKGGERIGLNLSMSSSRPTLANHDDRAKVGCPNTLPDSTIDFMTTLDGTARHLASLK